MSQDFSKGKIYKITNDYNDDVYVGSTCDTLIKRFSSHKSNINCKAKINRPLNVLMNEIGTERFRIDLVENYPCNDKYQLRQREGYWIREMGSLNMLVAGRGKKELYEENKEEILMKNKERYENNKEKYLETNRIYQQNHKEYYQEIKRKSAEKHKDENTIRKTNWYNENKERLSKESKEIIKCECGCEVVKGSLKRHQQSTKHLNLLQQQLPI